MKKIISILIIFICMIFVGCGTKNEYENAIILEEVEYVDTFNVEYLGMIAGHSFELACCIDLQPVVNKQVIVKYSSSDLILHIIYDGEDHMRYDMIYHHEDNIIDSTGKKYNEVYFTNIRVQDENKWTLKCVRYEDGNKEHIYMLR